MNFHFKQVNDPVHGAIHLSEVESDIISSGVFQRLHNIKQLGLGVAVYPGANYSRFSHSLGACHVAGRMIDAIRRNVPSLKICDTDKQLYRLAGLLHDIGHYPFSHSFEHAAKNHYSESLFADSNVKGTFDNHEKMGGTIIEKCPEITSILKKHGLTSEAVSDKFLSKKVGNLTALISSDLDCDRLDYLMRTAHHAGLPYGRVDLDYIVNNMTIDEQGSVCLNKKALRAADHLLVSRYYDYTQLPFHKTVAALELSFEFIIKRLLEGKLDCSSKKMTDIVKEGDWKDFDDQHLINLMRKIRRKNNKKDKGLIKHISSVVDRKPAKMVFNYENISEDDEAKVKLIKKMIEEKIKNWAVDFNIPEYAWSTWNPRPLQLTKYGDNISIDSELLDENEKSELVKIKGLNADNLEQSKPLVTCRNAMVNQLSGKKFFAIRVYVLLDDEELSKRESIKRRIHQDLNVIQN